MHSINWPDNDLAKTIARKNFDRLNDEDIAAIATEFWILNAELQGEIVPKQRARTYKAVYKLFRRHPRLMNRDHLWNLIVMLDKRDEDSLWCCPQGCHSVPFTKIERQSLQPVAS